MVLRAQEAAAIVGQESLRQMWGVGVGPLHTTESRNYSGNELCRLLEMLSPCPLLFLAIVCFLLYQR